MLTRRPPAQLRPLLRNARSWLPATAMLPPDRGRNGQCRDRGPRESRLPKGTRGGGRAPPIPVPCDTGGKPGTLGDEPGRRFGVVRDGKRGAPLCRPRGFATFRSGDLGPRFCRDRRPEALRPADFVARRSSAGGQVVGGFASHRVRSSRWANCPLQMPLRTRLTTNRCDLRHTSASHQRDLRPRTKIR